MGEKLPSLRPRQMVAALEADGFVQVRQSGSHLILRKGTLTVIVPMHARDLKPGTLRAILRQAKWTLAELRDRL